MGTTRTKAAKNGLTAGQLQAELRTVKQGMNALTKEINKLKKNTPLTKPGIPKMKPGPYVVGDECTHGLWEGKLAIREIAPALRRLSFQMGRIASFMQANKLPK